MEYPILFTVGQHRNEKAAYMLAPKVADELRSMGYEVNIVENPEKRNLMEIVLDADHRGIRLRTNHIERILNDWELKYGGRRRNIPPNHLFSFHGVSQNPTQFMDEDEQREFLEEVEIIYREGNFSQWGNNADNEIARRVYLFTSEGRIKIEIPEIQHATLAPEHLEAARRVMPSCLQYSNYLLETDLEATAQKGWLGPEMVQVLANGIRYIVDNNIDFDS